MPINPNALNLRAKIIGTLIRDARLAAERQIEECAQAIGVSSETFEAYELGTKVISLPELEGVAYYLDTPLGHFWGNQTISKNGGTRQHPEMGRLIQLRHRIIGALLRQARLEARLSLETLAKQIEIEPPLLEAYELGQEPVPVPHLEVLSGVLNRSIREFQDVRGPVGAWNEQQRALQDFQALPTNLQLFVSKPVNRPYLELALRLSDMPVERLRAVAEGLLEITY
jgi:transcriptional regulator with XRE-family HTH domain